MSDFTVYVALDSDNKVLYVGSTTDMAKRMVWHVDNSPWIIDASGLIQVPCDSKAAMLAEERRLIAKHDPPWNWLGRYMPNPRRKPSIAECREELATRRSAPDYINTAEFRLKREALNRLAESLDLLTERQSA